MHISPTTSQFLQQMIVHGKQNEHMLLAPHQFGVGQVQCLFLHVDKAMNKEQMFHLHHKKDKFRKLIPNQHEKCEQYHVATDNYGQHAVKINENKVKDFIRKILFNIFKQNRIQVLNTFHIPLKLHLQMFHQIISLIFLKSSHHKTGIYLVFQRKK